MEQTSNDHQVSNPSATQPMEGTATRSEAADGKQAVRDNFNGEKRKRGNRGGNRGGARNRDPRPNRDLGNTYQDVKRRRVDKRGKSVAANGEDAPAESRMSIKFSAEEIAAETRRPKRKVAVLIGYSGTGYKGMQINHLEKTIEGDLFAAFVATGAIAKTNADDPKKSGFTRCARTDKGVHAAGNVVSLKLIIEDEDIKQKINDALPPQIRVWDIQRTNSGFSCYQACDSRWYEYLLPSYALLPPHPSSYLGKKVIAAAQEKGVYETTQRTWEDVATFWDDVEKETIEPILSKRDSELRAKVVKRLHADKKLLEEEAAAEETVNVETEPSSKEDAPEGKDQGPVEEKSAVLPNPIDSAHTTSTGEDEIHPVEGVIREIKAAYLTAKRQYRITPGRLQQLQTALDTYKGTHNFHNYTIEKHFKDASAKRHIKSFQINPEPIQIGETQWLSLKVHGQSFMMHQIRKMVAMAVLVVRCATPLERIEESFGSQKMSIPKAPSLGLLLERPVFETYNKRAADQFGREDIDFSRYEKDIQAFKDKQIYTRIFETEERENAFSTFFNMLDTFSTDYFLWVTARGMETCPERTGKGSKALDKQFGDGDDEAPNGEDG